MPTFESIPPSEAVKNGRSKLEILQVLKRRLNESNTVITLNHVNAACLEAEKTILPLEIIDDANSLLFFWCEQSTGPFAD
jgi:hypothetical protein